MAKKKTRVLWLSKEHPEDTKAKYHLWYDKPRWYEDDKEFCDGILARDFCALQFERLCPALKLRKNTKTKTNLTNLKKGQRYTMKGDGIVLEKVK